MISRRNLIGTGIAFLAAPAIIRVAKLMPISVQPQTLDIVVRWEIVGTYDADTKKWQAITGWEPTGLEVQKWMTNGGSSIIATRKELT